MAERPAGRPAAERPAVERPRVFLASRNAKKLVEMRRILSAYVPGIEVLGLDDVPAYDEPPETEATFEGNALLKAHAAVEATGLPSLADVPDDRRGAHFTCAIAFAYPVGAGGVAEHVVHGEMPGRVIREMRGEGGFGYDVLFVPSEQAGGGELTSAEQPPDQKDAISHRGKAIRGIAPVVADVLTGL
jgi:XTP/dITP diphosphohydrolase